MQTFREFFDSLVRDQLLPLYGFPLINTNMNYAKTLLLSIIIVFVSTAAADSLPSGESKIEGVGLWWLDNRLTEEERAKYGTTDIVIYRLSFRESPEFATYCDGKNELYIYEKNSQGFACKLEYWEEWQGWQAEKHWNKFTPSDRKKLLKTIGHAKDFGDEGMSQYFVTLQKLKVQPEGIFTVSKTKLETGNWVVSEPTKEELDWFTKLAMQNMKSIRRVKDYTYKTVLGKSNKMIMKLAERQVAGTYTVKIRVANSEVILVPTLYEIEPLGGDLISSVIFRDGDNYRFIGHVSGCLRSVGPDLDVDGIPEILMEICNNSEGVNFNYIKLVPAIKSLVSYSAN
jgi:hypothetical protein